MQLHTYPSQCLLTKSAEVVDFDEKLIATASEMTDLMNKFNGVGLAAPQVGININLFIMRSFEQSDSKNVDAFINPSITWSSEDVLSISEGCLSFPTIFEIITRPRSIAVRYQDLTGAVLYKDLDGEAARCFQHELEHLNGQVFIKHLSSLKRDMIKRRMVKINDLISGA